MFVEPRSLPHSCHTSTFNREYVWVWQVGIAWKVVAPTGPGCSLSRLPVLLLCLLLEPSGAGNATCELEGAVQRGGLCLGVAAYGYGLSKHLVSKGVGVS